MELTWKFSTLHTATSFYLLDVRACIIEVVANQTPRFYLARLVASILRPYWSLMIETLTSWYSKVC